MSAPTGRSTATTTSRASTFPSCTRRWPTPSTTRPTARSLFAWSSLQVGIARDDEDVFDLPPGSPDRGQRVAAYYFWLFPNLMLNVYPWGISVNIVSPLGVDQTRVTFLSYVWDASRLDRGAGAGLDRVEREDEAVVESVQKGVRSRLYDRGRYSPSREQGVHHFHRLLARAMAAE